MWNNSLLNVFWWFGISHALHWEIIFILSSLSKQPNIGYCYRITLILGLESSTKQLYFEFISYHLHSLLYFLMSYLRKVYPIVAGITLTLHTRRLVNIQKVNMILWKYAGSGQLNTNSSSDSCIYNITFLLLNSRNFVFWSRFLITINNIHTW